MYNKIKVLYTNDMYNDCQTGPHFLVKLVDDRVNTLLKRSNLVTSNVELKVLIINYC